VRDGKPYSQIAHLAEDVRPYVAVADALRGYGLAATAIIAHDYRHGFLLVEDLGDRVYGVLIGAGADIAALYRPAVEVLIELRRHPAPERLPVAGGPDHPLPAYDARALGIEVELLVDWYWPAAKGRPADDGERGEFLAAWRPLIERMAAATGHWVLRDFHSPNLLELPERSGLQRVGLIDFQDAVRGHAAYDVVSLLQDARLDVPAPLERDLLDHYCAGAKAVEPSFDEAEFRYGYAVLGAQRATKILGIFARLALRDGKRGYLRHLPRMWTYLERDLRHPALAGLERWFAEHFPEGQRRGLEI
jgi:hypothetical protein